MVHGSENTEDIALHRGAPVAAVATAAAAAATVAGTTAETTVAPDPKKKAFEEKRIPPPAVRGPDKPQITEDGATAEWWVEVLFWGCLTGTSGKNWVPG